MKDSEMLRRAAYLMAGNSKYCYMTALSMVQWLSGRKTTAGYTLSPGSWADAYTPAVLADYVREVVRGVQMSDSFHRIQHAVAFVHDNFPPPDRIKLFQLLSEEARAKEQADEAIEKAKTDADRSGASVRVAISNAQRVTGLESRRFPVLAWNVPFASLFKSKKVAEVSDAIG